MSTFYPENDYRNYLQHHGVKGMHWGVRKDDYRRSSEYKADAKQRYKLGREATISDYSYRKANAKVEKLKKKINRNRGSIGLRSELSRNEWIKRQLQSKRDKTSSMLEKHVSKMKKTYGSDIADVKRNDNPFLKRNQGRINEQVINGWDWARAMGKTAGSTVLLSTLATIATGNPVVAGILAVPNPNRALTSDYRYLNAASRSDQGRMVAEEAMLDELKRLKE